MYRESYSEISKIMYTPHSSARQKIRQQFNLIPLAAIDTDENDERSNILQGKFC